METSKLTDYLGADYLQRLGATEAQIADVCRRAPNVPTAAIWLLQICGVKPSEAQLKRWSNDVKASAKPKKTRAKP